MRGNGERVCKYFVNCRLNAGRIWASTPQIADFRGFDGFHGLGNTGSPQATLFLSNKCGKPYRL